MNRDTYTVQQTSKTIKAGYAIGVAVCFAGFVLWVWLVMQNQTGTLLGLLAMFLLVSGCAIAGYARLLKWWHHD